MQTIFDWVTVGLFGILAVLFLHRSAKPEPHDYKVIHYAPPALGCALANYLGNNGQPLLAIAIVLATVGYILFVLTPFQTR